MRKTTSHFTAPGMQPPSISKTLRNYPRKKIKASAKVQPAQPTEETVDRLNTIGKTYPFCVNYKQQSNDPL